MSDASRSRPRVDAAPTRRTATLVRAPRRWSSTSGRSTRPPTACCALKLKVDGERIIDCYPIIGYLHRGTEKLFELHPFFQNVPHTDRMDYVAAATNNLAYVGAVEKLVGLTVPPRARYIRTILCELQRISSHLLWLATHAIDIGAMTPFFYCFREREQILDLFEEYCGARLTLNCMRPGGHALRPAGGLGRALPRVRRHLPGRRWTSTRAC